MSRDLDDVLGRTAEEVFESLAFVLPAFEEEEPPPDDSDDLTTAGIDFSGPFEGRLQISASDALLPAVAANMLGLDFGEMPAREVQIDAFKEMVNVICGNLLSRLADADAVFDVRAAEIVPDGAPPAMPVAATARLHLEGGWAELTLFAPEEVLVVEPGA